MFSVVRAAAGAAAVSDRTVVVGAHLDSVFAGPGINDDGSGSATLLETAEQMHELGISPRNKVRFMFFSGEEEGLLGSTDYASSLTKQQVQDRRPRRCTERTRAPIRQRRASTGRATSWSVGP